MIPYDKTNPSSIENYAKQLIGTTFYDVLKNNFQGKELEEITKYYNNPRGKGSLGNLLEEYFFYYTPNSESEPDFKEAGTELKVTPYEKTQKGKIKAGERLVIGMIPNREPIDEEFYSSHLFKKMKLILLILYLRKKELERTNYKIDYVTLFSILSDKCKEDLEIIKNDYKLIVDKIISGKAHELSEGDTKYLGACTKGGTADKSLQPQYYNKNILAKRRAFSLKQSYMTYVINHYILNNTVTYDSIFSGEDLKNIDFDKEILNRINNYKGKTEEEIYKLFDLDESKKAKNRNNIAVCRMLGVKTDKAAEFEKADIVIKTIRVKANGKPKESMSFPAMVIKKFVKEEFEESDIYNYFSKNRFLFVVFREENGEYILSGAKFWNMPITELETTGKKEWEKYKNKFIDGVNFKFKIKKAKNISDKTASGNTEYIVENDLLKKKETEIFHLRPHSDKSAYLIKGKRYGNGKETDMDELPNGDKMTKQCFWLNNTYIEKVIKDI